MQECRTFCIAVNSAAKCLMSTQTVQWLTRSVALDYTHTCGYLPCECLAMLACKVKGGTTYLLGQALVVRLLCCCQSWVCMHDCLEQLLVTSCLCCQLAWLCCQGKKASGLQMWPQLWEGRHDCQHCQLAWPCLGHQLAWQYCQVPCLQTRRQLWVGKHGCPRYELAWPCLCYQLACLCCQLLWLCHQGQAFSCLQMWPQLWVGKHGCLHCQPAWLCYQ